MEIEETVVAQIVDLAVTSTQIDTGRDVIALPKSMSLHDLETFQPTRRRFRGKFRTRSLGAFIDYVADFGDNQRCFVDPEHAQATIYFDIGTEEVPGHREHVAELKLEMTAAYAALCEKDSSAMKQRDMAEFLEDWRHILKPYSGDGVEYSINQAIAAVRKIDIKATIENGSSVQNHSASRSSLEKVEATSVETLPTGFTVAVRPYEELQERTLDLQLSVRASGDPMLMFRIVGYEQLVESIAQEFADLLESQVPEGMPATVGVFS